MSNFNWLEISDEQLLETRIRDLPLKLEESDLWPSIQSITEELGSAFPQFQPHLFIGDEWFSPEGVAAVSIPFFLLHPRLRRLEKTKVLECEGEDPAEFKKLLRHELGHALDHAFHLSRRKSWEQVFGSPQKEYDPDTYRPRPYSRNYVLHLKRWYAQSHPDEDFAETFAVWLDPTSQWKHFYKKWGALKKLEYIEKISKELRRKSFVQKPARMISESKYLNSTLGAYYQKKIRQHEEDYPDFFDKDLLRIFSKRKEGDLTSESAFQFMRRTRKYLLASLSLWTGEKKVTINALLTRLIDRCRKLELVVSKSEAETASEVSAFLTTLVSHYLFTGHFRRTV